MTIELEKEEESLHDRNIVEKYKCFAYHHVIKMQKIVRKF